MYLDASRQYLSGCQAELAHVLGDKLHPSPPRLGRTPDDIEADLLSLRVRLTMALKAHEAGGENGTQMQEAHDLLADLRDDLLTLRGQPVEVV